jgi:hypothetical protein
MPVLVTPIKGAWHTPRQAGGRGELWCSVVQRFAGCGVRVTSGGTLLIEGGAGEPVHWVAVCQCIGSLCACVPVPWVAVCQCIGSLCDCAEHSHSTTGTLLIDGGAVRDNGGHGVFVMGHLRGPQQSTVQVRCSQPSSPRSGCGGRSWD